MDTKDIRNIVFLSHSSAGKTSLIDSILFAAGANTRRGNVNDGSSMCDYNSDEIERKITIDPKVLNVEKDGKRINLLDTPGYADFISGVFSSLRAADYGVCLVCAVNGIEVGTSRAWDMLKESKKGAFFFINKLDKEHSNFQNSITAMQNEFGKKCVPVTYPIGKETSFKGVVDLLDKNAAESIQGDDKDIALKYREQLVEAAAEADDTLIEKYLGGEELTPDEVINGLKKAVSAGSAYPVFCGSATKSIGVEEIIKGIIKFAPSPQDIAPIQATSPDGNNPIEYKISPDEPFAAQVFKTVIDPYVGQLTMFRVFSGSLQSNTTFFNANKSTKERIGQLSASRQRAKRYRQSPGRRYSSGCKIKRDSHGRYIMR